MARRVEQIRDENHQAPVAAAAPEGAIREADGLHLPGVAAVTVELQGAVLPDLDPIDPDGRSATLGRYLLEALLCDIAGGHGLRSSGPSVRARILAASACAPASG
ncbi:MAG: hypothetical protein JOZ07_14055 [Solirubrobacterales bacterium]|nr:hypothetical protein [Solirubrobacterales bacterium]